MKKSNLIYIVLASFLFISSLSAQTPKWVSTEVQNRAAVLENFTDLYNIKCAMGLKIVNSLTKQYPNNFIVINNHCGIDEHINFGIEQPDLSTIEGNQIYNEVLSQGVSAINRPIASINRSIYPWAMTSDIWESIAKYIMQQPSVVNVYVKPEINITTRELIVEVEYYYTDDSPASENYLTVMLLQNEIIGYQKGGKEYDTDYVINDNMHYNMHALRTVISEGSTWGEPIMNPKKGSYECRKYKFILPAYIKNVPIDIAKLEVVAFISESTGNIYTGHKALVEVPKDIRTDLAVEDLTEYNNTLKFETIYPKIKITNNSDLPITNFDFSYTLANTKSDIFLGTLYGRPYSYTIQIYDTINRKTETYSGKLDKGESLILELPEITRADIKTASNYIAQASVSNIFHNDVLLLDINKRDNTTKISKISLIDTVFSETDISFESALTSLTSELPAHTVLDYSFNPHFAIQGTCGANNTKSAVYFLLNTYIEDVVDKPGYIMFGEVDCNDRSNKVLSYYYAYCDGNRNGTPPKIAVEISKDYGKSWQRISEITCEETGKLNSDIYQPLSSQYKFIQLNISDYINENFIIRIGAIPGSNGNALWIDEISIKNVDNEDIEENTKLSVYPNPASNILHINNNNLLGEEYEIYDMSGELIIKDINNSNIINVGYLSTGTYSLKIKDSIFNFIKE